MRRTFAFVCSTVLVMSGMLVAPGVATAADPPGQVLSVTVDAGPFSVDGFAGQAQSTITAVVDEPSFTIGDAYSVECTYTGVKAVLERTSGGPHDTAAVDLPRVSGSGSVGRYSAPWRIASTRNGTWTLTRLEWCDGWAVTSVDPRVSPGVTRTITVVGTHVPTTSVTRIPTTTAYGGKQSARYTYRTSTGAPIVGATVLSGTEYACMDPMPPSPGGHRWGDVTLRTDAAGQVTVPLLDLMTCVSLLGPPAVAGDLSTRALVREDWPIRREFYRWVSAVPTATAVRVNRTLTVLGSASPTVGVVRLQLLVGRTWRTVASARIRTSGRYTVYALVTTLGRNHYRVVALNGAPTLAPTPSRTITVTGTRT